MRRLTTVLHNFKFDAEKVYKNMGLPYKLGVLLYGLPGTGKSTTIKAIASYMRKNVYFIDLKNVHTNGELHMIFTHVFENSQNGGIVVFEDIDAMTDVVKRRVPMAMSGAGAPLSSTDLTSHDMIRSGLTPFSTESLIDIAS